MMDSKSSIIDATRVVPCLSWCVAVAAVFAATATASAQTSPLVHMSFDDVIGTPIASFDLDPVGGDGIFETASTVDSSSNGERFLGFGGSAGGSGTRLDGVTTTGTGLLSVAHNSNTRDNARMTFTNAVNGLAGGFESGVATILIDSWDFSTNPIGVGNDPEQIRFGFGHDSSVNSAAQVWITRSPFGVELQAQSVCGTGCGSQSIGTQYFGLTQNDPVSIAVSMDEVTDTYSIDFQVMDGVSAPVNVFAGNLGAINLDDSPLDADGLRGGYHLRLSFEGNFADDSFLIDDVLVTGVPVGGPALDGDLNSDGFVGIADLNIVLGNWNLNVPPADPAADPSGDNFVGIADLNVVLGNWNAGSPPSATAVPEPATLTLLCFGGLAMLRRRA
jgi:hypothetical protein